METAPGDPQLKAERGRLQRVLDGLSKSINDEVEQRLARLKSEHGIDGDWLQRFEQSQRPEVRNDFWNADIQRVPTTARLEDFVSYSYDRLMPLVNSDWLREQSALRYRQCYDDEADCRLHLVGRQRLLPRNAPARPHRLAQMLLICDDLLSGRHDIDFFDGPLLVSEAATLGVALSAIPSLGVEAEKKVQSLSRLPDREAAATIYELAVGAACVRAGRDVEMLATSSSEKMPDFRIHDLVVPTVVECKRRVGLNEYTEKEARQVERLYESVAPLFDRHHPFVEVEFKVEISSVSHIAFTEVINSLCESSQHNVEEETTWGKIRLRFAPSIQSCSTTRVFSPSFLLEVFGWNHVECDWDGLLCQIEPTSSPVISTVRWPRCLKWKCNTDKSRLKKARGLTSLWADATQQIPTGELGCIYIAYAEGMRAEIADARTRNLIDTVTKGELFHRASIQVPLTVVSRLYPQSFGDGALEMIESSMPMTLTGYDHMLAYFPSRIFVC